MAQCTLMQSHNSWLSRYFSEVELTGDAFLKVEQSGPSSSNRKYKANS